jgi:hypothetical protein
MPAEQAEDEEGQLPAAECGEQPATGNDKHAHADGAQ